MGRARGHHGGCHAQPRRCRGWAAEANRQRVLFLPQTRTMFPVEMLGSTAAENPLVLETNDASQAGLTACAGARQELTDVGSVPSSSITPQGTPEGPLGSHTMVFTFEHGCETSRKKERGGGAHRTGQLGCWPGQRKTGFRGPLLS